MKRLKVGIVGAGTAGLALAITLARQEHRVALFERSKELTPAGAGIMLQPGGIEVLDWLGCLEQVLSYGYRIDDLEGLTPGGRAVMKVAYRDLGRSDDSYALGMHRAALCHVLDEQLTLVEHHRRFNCDVLSVSQGVSEARIEFVENGETGQEAFDLVVIANGTNSELQPAAWQKLNRVYPWGAMWTIQPLDRLPASFDRPSLQQRYAGAQVMLGILPTGKAPGSGSRDLVSFFWSLPLRDIERFSAPDFDFDGWRETVQGYWPEISPMLASLSGPHDLIGANYRDVVLRRWCEGRVAIIGDAAHATSPQLGQGANLALQDARAMADAIARNKALDDAWADYHRQRAGPLRFYQGMSRWLTPFFQSNIPGCGMMRDLLMPVAPSVPMIRKQMGLTVAGFKTGWFSF